MSSRIVEKSGPTSLQNFYLESYLDLPPFFPSLAGDLERDLERDLDLELQRKKISYTFYFHFKLENRQLV